jgi:hypothetical protein
MSVEENLDTDFAEEPKRKRNQAAPYAKQVIKVRKHLVTTVYGKVAAEKLDNLHAEGHTILSITASSEIRGFDIISYREE